MELFDYIADKFSVCWKSHADAPIPAFNEEKVNIFNFNHDVNEPLRDKSYAVQIYGNRIVLFWSSQGIWQDLSGMKDEITRWAKYWLNKYTKPTILESLKIEVRITDRDSSMEDWFMIDIPITSKNGEIYGR